MSESFDPYYHWLAIPPDEQPPNHYRLLALRVFEDNPEVIENAANQRMAHLRTFQTGKRSSFSQKLLNEVAAAKICLLNREKKSAYDARLQEELETKGAAAAPIPQVDPDVLVALRSVAGEDHASVRTRITKADSGRKWGYWFAGGVLAGVMLLAAAGIWLRLFSEPALQPPRPMPPRKGPPSRVAPPVLPPTPIRDPLSESPHSDPDPAIAAVPAAQAPDLTMAGPWVEKGLKAELFEDPLLQRLVASRIEPQVDSPWPVGLPDQPPPPKQFSVRRTGWLRAPAPGPYKLILWSDRGVRLWLDGKLLVEDPSVTQLKRYEAEVPLSGEPHEFKLENYDTSMHAAMSLRWASGNARERLIPPQALYPDRQTAAASRLVIPAFDASSESASLTVSNGILAELFDGREFNRKVATRVDRLIDWPWDFTGPLPGVPADNFSVRWTGFLKPPKAGRYKLVAWNDDGARLWIDDKLLIDDWKEQTETKNEVEIDLEDRFYPLKLEYFESDNYARIRLGWVPPGAAEAEIVPASALFYELPRIDGNEEAAGRAAVPPEAEQQRLAKQIADTYKLPSLNSPEDKLRVAREMLDAVQHSQEPPAARYMLLRSAAELAQAAGDVELMLAAADAAGERFQIDSLSAKAKLLAGFAEGAEEAEQIEACLDAMDQFAREAVAADRVDLARQLAETAYRICERSQGTAYRKRAYDRRSELQKLAGLWSRVQAAQKTLETAPDDAAAQLQLGRWLALVKGDWQAGLPHLAKSGDKVLEPLAEKEAAAPSQPMARVALADAWWDAAQTAAPEYKPALLLRAGHWYRLAAPDLPALSRPKVEKRLQELGEVERPLAYGAAGNAAAGEPFPQGVWIDALSRADVRKHRVGGRWARDGRWLVSVSGPHSRIMLPVAVRGDYEVEVEFRRKLGDDAVCLLLPVGPGLATLVLSGSRGEYHALECVGGRAGNEKENETARRPGQLVNGQTYRLAVAVRRQGDQATVEASLDGKPLTSWQGDPARLAPERTWDLPQWNRLGLGAGGCPVEFQRVWLRSISGEAKLLDDDQAAPQWVRSGDHGGDEGAAFRDLAPAGSRLIGLRYLRSNIVAAIQPIYDTPQKRTFGRWCGREGTQNSPTLMAKEGYALGGLVVRTSNRIECLQAIFMRAEGDRLNPADSYRSEWIGTQAGGPELTIGGDGAPVIGVYGAEREYLRSLGLILAGGPGEAARSAGRLTQVEPYEASVGWGDYQVNRRKVPCWPMVSRDFEFCREYLFAHAPSRLVYTLPPDAKSLTAVGYCVGSFSAAFDVLVDGRSLYRSGAAGVVPIRLDLPAGGRRLELVVDPLSGNQWDESYWLLPRLHARPAAEIVAWDGNEPHVKLTTLMPESAQVGGGKFQANRPHKSWPIHLVGPAPCDDYLFTHGSARAVFPVPDAAEEFSAIGYCTGSQSVKFRVTVDGQTLFESQQAGVVPIRVPLPPAAGTLNLVVDPVGDPGYDDAFWCYPRFTPGAE